MELRWMCIPDGPIGATRWPSWVLGFVFLLGRIVMELLNEKRD